MKQSPEQNECVKIHQYCFVALIKKIEIHLKFQCEFKVQWKIGNQVSLTKSISNFSKNCSIFNETMVIQTNLSYDVKSNVYRQKMVIKIATKNKFTVLIFSQKGNKQAGEFTFDLATFLNSQQHLKGQNKDHLNHLFTSKLQKCPDQNALLEFQLTSKFIREIETHLEFIDIQQSNRAKSLNCSFVAENCDFKKKNGPMVMEANIKSPLQQINSQKYTLKNQRRKRYSLTSSSSNVGFFQQKLNMLKITNLQQSNSKLMIQYDQMKELQKNNSFLKSELVRRQKQLKQYYNNKLQQFNSYIKTKQKQLCKIQKKQEVKKQKQLALHKSKQKMGNILNYAFMKGLYGFADQLMNIFNSQSHTQND